MSERWTSAGWLFLALLYGFLYYWHGYHFFAFVMVFAGGGLFDRILNPLSERNPR